MFERSLALRRDPLQNEAGVVENLVDLARLHAATGDTARAQEELRRALAQLHARVGDRHPLAVDILGSLCTLRRAQGDVRGAEDDCRTALALSPDLQGPQHRDTVDARRQIAALHVDQGRSSEAAEEFPRSQAWLLAPPGVERSA